MSSRTVIIREYCRRGWERRISLVANAIKKPNEDIAATSIGFGNKGVSGDVG